MDPDSQESSGEVATNTTILFATKLAFIVLCFFEGLIAGMVPTWSSSCRGSPKILGFVNAFAGGVFLGIAFMDIIPEMIEAWTDM